MARLATGAILSGSRINGAIDAATFCAWISVSFTWVVFRSLADDTGEPAKVAEGCLVCFRDEVGKL